VQAEYTIDELARAADTTVRSVRVYHERGLLPSPELRGRIGYYGDEHLARLQTISRLLSRGMKLNGIRELLDAWGRGDGLAEVLGVPDQPPACTTHSRPAGSRPGHTAPASHDIDTVVLHRPATPQGANPAGHLIDSGLSSTEARALIERLRADCERIVDRHARELLHRLAGRTHDHSGATADNRAELESTTATAYLAITRTVTELLEQGLARYAHSR
jgi:DNA-binding transcriptional MerR regulator